MKKLGKSNDSGVPSGEIFLAKIIQNAAARGLNSTDFSTYRDESYMICGPHKARYCCALGAALLEKDTTDLKLIGLEDGNDDADRIASMNDQYLTGYTIGQCFRDALR